MTIIREKTVTFLRRFVDDLETLKTSPESFWEGDTISLTREGYSYVVAANDADDHHLTTQSGVKLYVQPGTDGGVNVDAFGAVGDGVTDDSAAIQTAIDNFKMIVFGPKTYAIENPLYVLSNQHLRGAGANATTIVKTTATTGTGSNLQGTATDSYEKNAILIFKHQDDNFAYNVELRSMRMKGANHLVEYGIYAPRLAQFHFEDLEILNCRYGIATHDAWMGNMTRVVVNANSVAPEGVPHISDTPVGWSDSKGFWWKPSPVSGASGTTLGATNCWARDCHIGWDMTGLSYSSLNACGSDNITGQAYKFESCEIAVTGCGMENVQHSFGAGAFQISGGRCSMVSFRGYQVFGNTSGSGAMLASTDGGKLTVLNSRIEDFADAGTAHNWAIETGAQVFVANSSLPSNGNSFIGFSEGASLTIQDGKDVSVRSEEANRTVLYKPRAEVFGHTVQDIKNKAISSSGTAIATITADATAALEMAAYQFRIVWRDISYPYGMGIDTLDVICTRDGDGNFRQSVTIVNNTVGGNGVTTAPTYSIARAGNVWTLTMTPAHGDCTAMSVRVQELEYTGMTLNLL